MDGEYTIVDRIMIGMVIQEMDGMLPEFLMQLKIIPLVRKCSVEQGNSDWLFAVPTLMIQNG